MQASRNEEFYVRLKQAADEIDLCKHKYLQCVEMQKQHAVMFYIRDEEIKQRLLELSSGATLEKALTVCKSHVPIETSHKLQPSISIRVPSAYKKNKELPWEATTLEIPAALVIRYPHRQVYGYATPQGQVSTQQLLSDAALVARWVTHFAYCCRSKPLRNVETSPGGRVMIGVMSRHLCHAHSCGGSRITRRPPSQVQARDRSG